MGRMDERNSNRIAWEFAYTGKALAEAATAKRDHHQERVEVWRQEQTQLMIEVRESGLEINEDLAMRVGSSMSRPPHVSVKDHLQTKLRECHAKIQDHLELVHEYDGWVQVLGANPEATLKLKYDDWLFYFGAD